METQVSATPMEATANSWWLQSQHIYKLLLLQSVSKWTPKSPKNSVPFSIFQRHIEHVRPWPASYVQGTVSKQAQKGNKRSSRHLSVATCYAKQWDLDGSYKLRAMCLPLRLCIAALCNGCWLCWMLGFVAHLLRLSHEDLEDHEVILPYFAMVRSLTSYEINAWRLRRLRRLRRLLRLTCLTFSRLNGVIAGISCNYFRINQIFTHFKQNQYFQHFSTYFNTLQQFDTVQELSNARTGRTAWPTGLCGDNERTRSTALSTWPCSVPYVCRTYLRALPKAVTLNVTGRVTGHHWLSSPLSLLSLFIAFQAALHVFKPQCLHNTVGKTLLPS